MARKKVTDLSKRPPRHFCAGCGDPYDADSDYENGLVVGVHMKEGGSRSKQITSISRSRCESCAVELYEELAALMP